MADASQLQLNPYALFDPSQWANPYSSFQNRALPAASYAGWPTDAMGNPIQPQPGMTINQTPSQPAAAPAAASGANNAGTLGLINSMIQNIYSQGANANSSNPTGQGAMLNSLLAQRQQLQNQPNQAVAAAPAAGPNSAGLSPQQYMALRANPGPVPTFGATVPQSASSSQPGSGVLQQFLANWKPAQSGPGAGFQQGFASALKGMGYT